MVELANGKHIRYYQVPTATYLRLVGEGVKASILMAATLHAISVRRFPIVPILLTYTKQSCHHNMEKIHIYTYIYTYIYIYMYVCVCIYIYIYV